MIWWDSSLWSVGARDWNFCDVSQKRLIIQAGVRLNAPFSPLSAIYSPISQPKSPTVAKERAIILVYVISKRPDNGCEEKNRIPVLRNLAARVSRWGPFREHPLAVSTIGAATGSYGSHPYVKPEFIRHWTKQVRPSQYGIGTAFQTKERDNWRRWISPEERNFGGNGVCCFLCGHSVQWGRRFQPLG